MSPGLTYNAFAEYRPAGAASRHSPRGDLHTDTGAAHDLPAVGVIFDPARDFVAAHLSRAGAQTAVDAGLRIDTTVMLVDDPVKRVDNMTMAHGLEARVPFLDHEFVELAATCPPELKLAQGGKGVLKEIGRRVLPAEVIDRPKGYFPVPALKYLDGPVLELARDALGSRAAKERGIFRPAYLEALLDDPRGHLTPLGGSELWQAALLELWLQAHAA